MLSSGDRVCVLQCWHGTRLRITLIHRNFSVLSAYVRVTLIHRNFLSAYVRAYGVMENNRKIF